MEENVNFIKQFESLGLIVKSAKYYPTPDKQTTDALDLVFSEGKLYIGFDFGGDEETYIYVSIMVNNQKPEFLKYTTTYYDKNFEKNMVKKIVGIIKELSQ